MTVAGLRPLSGSTPLQSLENTVRRENLLNTKKPEVTMPWLAVGLFCAPIFFINFLLPALPQSSLDLALNDFVDNHLLGLIGFWSSLFPFSSKITANYIAITGPIFATVIFYKVYKTMHIDPAQYQTRFFARLIAGILFTVYIVLFCTFAFYLSTTDLGSGKGKYGSLFGDNTLFYSIFSSGTLILFFMVPFSIHRLFFYFPPLIIKKWRERRMRNRSE